MAAFELYRDEKVTMWRRHTVTVEAETLDEAVAIVSGENTWEHWEELGVCETTSTDDSYESVELLAPDSNQATVEIIHHGDGEKAWHEYDELWDNRIDPTDQVSLFICTRRAEYSYLKTSAFPVHLKAQENTPQNNVAMTDRKTADQFIAYMNRKHPDHKYPDIDQLRFLFNTFDSDAQNNQV